MLRIDLGCGTNKQTGFIGVDRYPLPGVDIIADMNGLLPFRDDSVDLLFASHSLEHVQTLLATMREVYRICKHSSQLCVIAPYSEQKLNLANPYHTCVFNEHTPRFWTPYPSAPIDPEEFTHPMAPQWGLSQSDHSDPGIDIRLVRMEHFYFPQYAGLSPSEQRRLRRERVDVCDQIMYHLIVWKGAEEGAAKSFDDYVGEFQAYEPEYIPLLRNRGREMLLQKSTAQLEEARAAIARLEGEMQCRAADAAMALSQTKRVEELTADLERYKTIHQELRLDHHQQRSSLSAALEESFDLRNRLLEAKATLVSANGELAQLTEAKGKAIQDRDQALAKEAILANELTSLRHAHVSERTESERLRAELTSLKKSHGDLQASETRLAGQFAAACEVRTAEAEVSERLQQELAGARGEVHELRAHLALLTGQLTPILENELPALRHAHACERTESERLRDELISLQNSHGGLQASEALLASRLAAASEELAGAKDEVRELRTHLALLTAELARLHTQYTDQTEVVSRMTTELHETAAYNRVLRDQAAGSGRELEFARVDLRRETAAAAASKEEASVLVQRINALQTSLESSEVLMAKLGLTQAELETTAALLSLARQKEELLGAEIATAKRQVAAAAQDAERQKTLFAAAKRSLGALCAEARILPRTRLIRAGGFFVAREGSPRRLPGRFAPLQDYCDRHFHAAKATVVLSDDLGEAPYREYEVPFELDRLTSVLLAIRPLLPGSSGIAGIEIVSAESEILAQTHLPLTAIHPDEITRFQLSVPLSGLKNTWLLRVFVRDADAPVPIYELALATGGLLRGATQFFPFVLFE